MVLVSGTDAFLSLSHHHFCFALESYTKLDRIFEMFLHSASSFTAWSTTVYLHDMNDLNQDMFCSMNSLDAITIDAENSLHIK